MGRAERKKIQAARREARALRQALEAGGQVPTKLSVFANVLQQWQGPLPPPEWLKKYDEALPGLADRLFKSFESQVRHRIEIESIVVRGNTESQARGQWFALTIALGVLALAFFLVHLGQVGWAIGTVLTEILMLAGVFVYGREKQAEERWKKREQLDGQKPAK